MILIGQTAHLQRHDLSYVDKLKKDVEAVDKHVFRTQRRNLFADGESHLRRYAAGGPAKKRMEDSEAAILTLTNVAGVISGFDRIFLRNSNGASSV
jgi:hypothetical protein